MSILHTGDKIRWALFRRILWAFLWRYILLTTVVEIILGIFVNSLFAVEDGFIAPLTWAVLYAVPSFVLHALTFLIVFRLVLFKKYKKNILKSKFGGSKWVKVIRVWWKFYWRYLVFAVVPATVVGGVSGAMTGFLGRSDLVDEVSSTWGVIIKLVAVIFVLKLVIEKNFLLERAESSSDAA